MGEDCQKQKEYILLCDLANQVGLNMEVYSLSKELIWQWFIVDIVGLELIIIGRRTLEIPTKRKLH